MNRQQMTRTVLVAVLASTVWGCGPKKAGEDIGAIISRYIHRPTPSVTRGGLAGPATGDKWLLALGQSDPDHTGVFSVAGYRPTALLARGITGSEQTDTVASPNDRADWLSLSVSLADGEEGTGPPIAPDAGAKDDAAPGGDRHENWDEKPWGVKFKIYGWLPTYMDGTVQVGDDTADLHYNCRDLLYLLDELTCLFEGELEARVGRWGVIADLIHVRLEDTRRAGLVKEDLSFELTILETGGFYRVGTWALPPECGKSISLDFLAGARYIKLGGDALIGGRHDKIDLGGDREWWDMFVGPRSTWQATEELALFARGDVGGFGIGSSSQLTWQIKAGGEYAISKYAFLELGYRLLDIDYEEGSGSDKFRFDVQMGGPYMGLGVKF